MSAKKTSTSAKSKSWALLEEQADTLYEFIKSDDTEWVKEWNTQDFKQQNRFGSGYQNINQLHLFLSSIKNNYKDPRWLTFNQINSEGFHLKKGSKASRISFVSYSVREKELDQHNQPIKDAEGKFVYREQVLNRPIVKIYNVFNASQVEGIEPFKKDVLSAEFSDQLESKKDLYERADLMLKAYCEQAGVKFQEIASESAAFTYSKGNKEILNPIFVMPLRSQFNSPDHYYATAFHEVAHATVVQHKRDTGNYAREELVAELSSMFLCRRFGFDGSDKQLNVDNSISYLKGWIESGALTKKDFVTALKDAQQATKMITKYDLSQDERLMIKDAQKNQAKNEKTQNTNKGLSV